MQSLDDKFRHQGRSYKTPSRVLKIMEISKHKIFAKLGVTGFQFSGLEISLCPDEYQSSGFAPSKMKLLRPHIMPYKGNKAGKSENFGTDSNSDSSFR